MLLQVENIYTFFIIISWFLDKAGNAYVQQKHLFNFTRTEVLLTRSISFR